MYIYNFIHHQTMTANSEKKQTSLSRNIVVVKLSRIMVVR